MDTFYALNSQTKINPSKPTEGSSYFGDPGQVLIVCQPVGYNAPKALRVVSAHGYGEGDMIGTRHQWVQQSFNANDRQLSDVVVVGLVYADGRTEGEVPTRSFTHNVMK